MSSSSSRMKVVIAHRNGGARVVELPEPRAGRNFVTVRVSHSALTLPDELHQIEHAARLVRRGEDGLPLGSCASGTIVEVGNAVRTLKSGLRVAVTGVPYVYHAEHLVVPEHLVVELPKKVNHEEGSFAGQGAAALNLLRTARVQLGDVVLVLGADLLGMITAQVVRAAGATPVIVDNSEYRLSKIKTVGAVHVFTPQDEHLLRAVEMLSDGAGVDSVLLTRSQDEWAWDLGTHLVRHQGAIVLGAPTLQPVPLELVREKGLEVRIASGGGPAAIDLSAPRWTERSNMACFCQLLAERKVQLSPLVTDRIPLERAPLAYEKAARGRDAALAVVFTV